VFQKANLILGQSATSTQKSQPAWFIGLDWRIEMDCDHLSYAPSLVRVWQQKHSEPFGDPEKMG